MKWLKKGIAVQKNTLLLKNNESDERIEYEETKN